MGDNTKKAARARMAETGESYTTARRRVMAEHAAELAGDCVRCQQRVAATRDISIAAAAAGGLGAYVRGYHEGGHQETPAAEAGALS